MIFKNSQKYRHTWKVPPLDKDFFLKKALQKLDIEKKILIKKFSLKFVVGKTMVKH